MPYRKDKHGNLLNKDGDIILESSFLLDYYMWNEAVIGDTFIIEKSYYMGELVDNKDNYLSEADGINKYHLKIKSHLGNGRFEWILPKGTLLKLTGKNERYLEFCIIPKDKRVTPLHIDLCNFKSTLDCIKLSSTKFKEFLDNPTDGYIQAKKHSDYFLSHLNTKKVSTAKIKFKNS